MTPTHRDHPDRTTPAGHRPEETDGQDDGRLFDGPREDRRRDDSADAPAPDDPHKPDSPTDITGPSWRYVLRTTMREFAADGCTDLAAGLTYRTVLSVFPALIALVSILSLFGQDEQSVNSVLEQARGIVPADAWATVQPVLQSILTAPAAGLGLVLGLATALWSASTYTRAFGRAMNTIHDVPEGRGTIKLTVQMCLLTALFLVLGAVGLVIFVLSGPVAESVGAMIGLGPVAVLVWNVAKWVVLAGIVVLSVALLYYATPNVKQPRFRWVSIGALLAIIVAVLATIGFFLYASNFGSYNATYGALAGVIILLLWIYIINVILLFGAELDSEIERGRELQAGIPAEEELQLPPRDTRASDKRARKYAEDVERGRILRESAGRSLEDPSAGGEKDREEQRRRPR